MRKLRYVEKHYGSGDGKGERILNPQTIVHMEEGSYMEMEAVQIKGVDSTVRETRADLAAGATLVVKEKIMTHGVQYAETKFYVDLNGEDSSTNVVSRSVAKEDSTQYSIPRSMVITNVQVIQNAMPLSWTGLQ